MDTDRLIAIDTHTHLEVSCRNPFDNHGEAFDRAADQYFKSSRRPTMDEGHALRRRPAAAAQGARRSAWPLRVADDYLRGLGFTLLAWAWARTALAVLALDAGGDGWLRDKLNAARFGVQWLLPEARLHWQRLRAREAVLPPAAAA